MLIRLAISLMLVVIVTPPRVRAQNDVVDFQTQVAPLLATRCLGCHSGPDAKGGLNLANRATAMSGGDSGAAIVSGDLDRSLLWQQVTSDQMPPKQPLAAADKAIFQAWIASGAAWAQESIDPLAYSSDARAGLDWWSLQPLTSVTPPWDSANKLANSLTSSMAQHPLDAFIYQRLHAVGLTPSPPADRRTLIRRLSFDLIGLPPTVAEADAFINDTSPAAYEQLVDRLLNSPHYGERWARHWLDIVRFGESNGFEYDEPRDNFWPYRNWVIDAFNSDMPYDQFVLQQIAGDALAPDDYSAAAATGFLVAGPHNTTLPSNAKMRMAMAQDEMEDLLGIVGQTFLGLTINCARCHDHKFDPISQRDYYQLAAALGGAAHGQRTVTVPLSSEQATQLDRVQVDLERLERERELLTEPIRQALIAQREQPSSQTAAFQPPQATYTWEFDGDTKDTVQGFQLRLVGGAKVSDGALVLDGQRAHAVSTNLPLAVGEKTLEVWLKLNHLDQRGGGAISLETADGAIFDALVYGEQEARRWMAGSNSFVRTQSFRASGDEATAHEQFVHLAIVYRADGTIAGYRQGVPYGQPYLSPGLQAFQADASRLVFGLRHSPPGGNRLLAASIERAQFYDRALSEEEVALSAAFQDIGNIPRSLLVKQMSAAERQQFESIEQQLDKLENEQRSLLNAQKQTLYCCISTKPPEARVLLRGDVGQPGEVVAPRGLSALQPLQPDWDLPATATDHQRRLRLAQWITDRRNPLLARVMVNRLWQYHFGRGLVTTPSDFGFNGGQPSHPELLDWLAGQLVASGYRLKAVQRLIVTSQTYQQSSRPREAGLAIDADNQWLWRKSPQRIEAETLRDSLLVVTGRLDRQVGGVGYRDMKHFFYKGSHFYELLAESGPEARRRTIYRFVPRGATNPFLTTFDCPDPSATAPRRASTTTPLQALALLNNAIVFQMADDLAAQASHPAGADLQSQINQVYQAAYTRQPTERELQQSLPFVQKHGLAALCRVLFNSNEFLTVP